MAIPADDEMTTKQPPNGGLRELKPMEVDVTRIVLIGTVLYAVAAVVLLPMHTSLTNDGHGRWPWIAVSGVGLGLLGLYYLKRRDRAIARDREKAAQEPRVQEPRAQESQAQEPRAAAGGAGESGSGGTSD